MNDTPAQSVAPAQTYGWTVDGIFIGTVWVIGGFGSVATVFLGLHTPLFNENIASNTSLQDTRNSFVVFSILYIAVSVVMIWSFRIFSNRYIRSLLLAAGGASSLIYLSFSIPLSGSIIYSPLSVTLIYLPTITTWYLANSPPLYFRCFGYNMNFNLLAALAFSVLCVLLYGYLLHHTPEDNLAVWIRIIGTSSYLKNIKWFVVAIEIGTAVFFGFIVERGLAQKSTQATDSHQ